VNEAKIFRLEIAMNIKSILLGSAAALVAVSGARAADAVVIAEPEPVEYVRVCDVYGAGFFYIPGTETCLAISGYVWYQVTASSYRGGRDTVGFNDWFGVSSQNWASDIEARVNFDARSETEWGMLRGYIRLQANWDAQNQIGTAFDAQGNAIGTFNYGGDGVVRLDQAFLSLGGLRMGYTESAWNDTMNGGASSWGSYTWGGLYYAYQQRNVIQYSFTGGNGFFATLSLEDDGNSNFMPDVVGVAGIGQSWGSVWAKVAYDEDIAPGSAAWLGARAAGLSGVDGWAASLGAQVNLPMEGHSLRLLGFYANNANAYSVGGRWSVMAAYYGQFTPTLAASVAAQYIADTNYAAAGSPSLLAGELAFIWTPVTNFEVRSEINYDKATGQNGTVSGFLRFTRYF
jgi:hypothetical protein